jgi:fructosamine-3-kinase
LGNLKVKPVLLHGNLDFDSFLINSLTDEATTYDPQSYYGHNEIDLAYLCSYFYPEESPGKDFFTQY